MKSSYLLIIAVCFLLACSSAENKQEEKEQTPVNHVTLTAEQKKSADIQTGNFEEKFMDALLKVNGVVDVPPQNIVSISFPSGGYLKSTGLLPGMHVRKGESIAVIEDQSLIQLQQDYLVTKAKLKYAQLDFERQKSLNETKAAADKVVQQSEAEFSSLSVLLRSLSEKLKLVGIDPSRLDENNISRAVSIRSPINGYVSKVNVNIGKYVQPADVLFELINPQDIHAALTVFEKDINLLKKGQPVSISFVNDTSTTYPAEILLITQNVDENRSGTVHCHFEKMPQPLRPGMFINAEIQVAGKKVVAVPEDAVVRFESKEYIFIVEGKDNYVLTPVQTGMRSKGMIEIIDGSNDLFKKQFVTRNAFTLLSKMKNVAEE